MKTLSLISAATVLGTALFAGPVHAEDTPALPPEFQAMVAELLKLADSAHVDDARAHTVTPEIQAMLAQLLKSMELELPKEMAPINPSTAAGAPAPTSAPNSVPTDTHDSKASLGSTSLRTSSLASGGLMPSASLGGRGTSGVAVRLSDADWRTLFPKKQDSK